MHYDFVEIGTCDFDTLLENNNFKTGLQIEPLRFYLDRLPDREGVIKVNCAISDKDSIVDVYWIDPKDIEQYQLPYWLRGCNSIITPHPTAQAELSVRNLLHLYKKEKCESITWSTLIKRYQIKSITCLKIDTEGHDCLILNDILKSGLKVLPDEIIFESNALSDLSKVEKIISDFKLFNYDVLYQNPDNTCLKLLK